MSASHASQRDLFEVSVPEVDALVERLEAQGALRRPAHRRRLRRERRRPRSRWLDGQLAFAPMEAASAPTRALASDKAERIVEAMRTSVARRGVAGSTFDHVAREAGVSRGLLHYYFGTKERLLVEVVRRDCEVRMASLDERMAGAHDARRRARAAARRAATSSSTASPRSSR